jgi:mono/diheme cytochrome c family protein
MPRPRVLACAASLLLLALGPAGAADPERGKLLHGTFCLGCHGDSVAKRENRAARSYAELRRQVARWQAVSGLGWESQDVDDVAAYLNAAYYKLPCEGSGC